MEKIYTIPLRKAFTVPKTRRASTATKTVKAYLADKLKLPDVKLDSSVNEALWSKGMSKPPRSIKIKVTEEDGQVTASIAK